MIIFRPDGISNIYCGLKRWIFLPSDNFTTLQSSSLNVESDL